MCTIFENELSIRQGFRKLSFDRHIAYKRTDSQTSTIRPTDTTEILYHNASQVGLSLNTVVWLQWLSLLLKRIDNFETSD